MKCNFMEQIEEEIKKDPILGKLVYKEEFMGNDITELILEKMEEKGVSALEISKELNMTDKEYLRLIRHPELMLLSSLLNIFYLLGYDMGLVLTPLNDKG